MAKRIDGHQPVWAQMVAPDGTVAWGDLTVHGISSGPKSIRDLQLSADDIKYSQIMDNLFLGNQDIARDIKLLKSLNITHIVNLATGVDNVYDGILTYLRKEVYDGPTCQIITVFDECTEFVHNAITSGGCVLVHCNAGISRAASVVIAYLMKYKSMNFYEALAFTKSKRSWVRPNAGFLQQLQDYEKKLQC